MPYATVEDYKAYTLLSDEELPDNLDYGLLEASRFMDRTLQIQAAYVIENFSNVTAEDYEIPTILQVIFWAEIAGGDEVDTSQNILRPTEGYSRVGDISIPQYETIAPQVIEELQLKGLWDPSGSFFVAGVE